MTSLTSRGKRGINIDKPNSSKGLYECKGQIDSKSYTELKKNKKQKTAKKQQQKNKQLSVATVRRRIESKTKFIFTHLIHIYFTIFIFKI